LIGYKAGLRGRGENTDSEPRGGPGIDRGPPAAEGPGTHAVLWSG
jgi:hypothetical protein